MQKPKSYFYISLIFLVGPFCLHSQNRKIDSLKHDLKKTISDSARCLNNYELSNYYLNINLDTAIKYAKETERLARKLKDEHKVSAAKLKQAQAKFYQKKFDEAAKIAHQVIVETEPLIKIATGEKQIKFKKLLAHALKNEGEYLIDLNSFDPSITAFHKSLELYSELKDTLGMIRVLGTIERPYKYSGKRQEAIEFKLKALELCKNPKHKENKGVLHGNLGLDYSNLGNYEKSFYHLKIAVEIDSSIHKEEGVVRHLVNMSSSYRILGNYAMAIAIQYRALKKAEAINHSQSIAFVYHEIAITNAMQSFNKEAEMYFQKCLEYYKKLNLKGSIAGELDNIGVCFNQRADSARIAGNSELQLSLNKIALDYFNQALTLKYEINDESGIGFSQINMAQVYSTIGQYQKCIEYSLQGIKSLEKFDEKATLCAAYTNISNAYVRVNNYTQGETYLFKSLKIANELSSIKDLKYCYDGLYNLYKKTNKPKDALKYYELFITITDSIKNDDNSKALVKQQLKYEYEKQAAADSVAFAKESEIKNVQLQKQKAEIRAKKNQQYALFGGLALVIIFAGFMYNRFKITQKQKEIIDEQKTLVEHQKLLVEEKQKEVLDSIRYAKRIQTALLPSDNFLEKSLNKLQYKKYQG